MSALICACQVALLILARLQDYETDLLRMTAGLPCKAGPTTDSERPGTDSERPGQASCIAYACKMFLPADASYRGAEN